jgi:hypothetical protein
MRMKADADHYIMLKRAEAEAKAVQEKVKATGGITDNFVREVLSKEMEVRVGVCPVDDSLMIGFQIKRVGAYGNKTVFVPEGIGKTMAGSMATGLAVGMGEGAGHK